MSLFEERWRELADIKDELAARDWFPATSGNLSMKVSGEPLQFWITASGKDKRKRTDDDFLLVDGKGKPVHETFLKPSAETIIHCEVYNRTDAGCCLHVHTVANNVISELYAEEGEVTFTNQEIIKAFGIWEEDGEVSIPIVPNIAHIPRLAAQMGSYMDDRTVHGILIRNHGITVWGKDGFEAKKFLEAFEFLFVVHLQLLQYQ